MYMYIRIGILQQFGPAQRVPHDCESLACLSSGALKSEVQSRTIRLLYWRQFAYLPIYHVLCAPLPAARTQLCKAASPADQAPAADQRHCPSLPTQSTPIRKTFVSQFLINSSCLQEIGSMILERKKRQRLEALAQSQKDDAFK